MNLVVPDPVVAARFYEDVFGLRRMFESEWFVHLAVENDSGMELGLLKRGHSVTPRALKQTGDEPDTLLTIVVEDADETCERAVARGAECLETPQNMFYGQRRAVVRSPDGTLLDISAPCDPDPSWIQRVSQTAAGGYVESSE